MSYYLKLSKFKLFYILLINSFFLTLLLHGKSSITYTLTAGRFGDHLTSYLRAEYLAYKYDLNLVYTPFKYSNELTLDRLYKNQIISRHKNRTTLSNKNLNLISSNSDTLYHVPYFPESSLEREKFKTWKNIYFPIDWEDKGFREYIIERLTPIKNIQTIIPPKNYISVAIHLREGGKFDTPNCYRSIPFKFPPMQFYNDALLKIATYFPNKPIYCFVFTDCVMPEKIISQLYIPYDNHLEFILDYRHKNNSDKTNILEDFFSFFNFDILIRPESNFSIIPSLLHDYAMLITPKTITTINKKEITVTDFNILINENFYQNLLNNSNFAR